MIKIPFDRESFSDQLKPRLSGVNISLEFDNIESALIKSAVEISKIIGTETYLQLCGEQSTALDALQRAMLNHAVNDHLIYLITRIGNDGITVKKNDDETTIFKYQQDDLKNNLINTTWFWMDQLLTHLNENKEYEKWKESAQYKDINSLPITPSDLRRWLGIDSLYFYTKSAWIIRKIDIDQLHPRITSLSDEEQKTFSQPISRALCYQLMYESCMLMPYADLPENIRKDIDNEQKKSNSSSESYVRDKIAKQFKEDALRYWTDLERQIQSSKPTPTMQVSESTITESDSFCFV